MMVGELIEELKKFPEDTRVVTRRREEGHYGKPYLYKSEIFYRGEGLYCDTTYKEGDKKIKSVVIM